MVISSVGHPGPVVEGWMACVKCAEANDGDGLTKALKEATAKVRSSLGAVKKAKTGLYVASGNVPHSNVEMPTVAGVAVS